MSETINILCELDGKAFVKEVSGRSIWLMVGPEKVRFFLHDLGFSHYASGRRISAINPAFEFLLDEDVAQVLLQDVIEKHGIGAVLARMESLPKLNFSIDEDLQIALGDVRADISDAEMFMSCGAESLRRLEWLLMELERSQESLNRVEKIADNLSAEISRISGVSIGEQSNNNSPWRNALKLAADVPEFSHFYQRVKTLEDAVSEAQFLCERLREYESDSNQSDDNMRIWTGHVVPPLARSEKAVSEALKGGAA